MHSVDPPFLLEGVEPPTKLSKSGGLIFSGWLVGKRGGDLFEGMGFATFTLKAN